MVFCSNTLKVQPSACSTAQCSWAAPGRTIGCSMHEPHSLLLAMLQISLLNPCSAVQHMHILPFAGLCPCSSPFSVHLVLPNYPERGIGKNAWVEKEMFITLKCTRPIEKPSVKVWRNSLSVFGAPPGCRELTLLCTLKVSDKRTPDYLLIATSL